MLVVNVIPKVLSSPEQKFLIWLHYNYPKLQLENIPKIADEFNRAMKSKTKFCGCSNKPKSVNSYWDDWHCTWCLKPTKEEK